MRAEKAASPGALEASMPQTPSGNYSPKKLDTAPEKEKQQLRRATEDIENDLLSICVCRVSSCYSYEACRRLSSFRFSES